jgi:hypothetical protein
MKRTLLLIMAAVVVFSAVAVLMVKLMPSPLKDADYMVIGAVATLAALFALALIFLFTTMKGAGLYTKRPKRPRNPPPAK